MLRLHGLIVPASILRPVADPVKEPPVPSITLHATWLIASIIARAQLLP